MARHLRRVIWFPAVVAFALTAWPVASARADVISPEQDACSGKAKGDACAVAGTEGACQESSCSKRDYSDGPPGKSVQVPCTLCVAGAKPATPAKGKDKGCSAGAGPTAAGSALLGLGLLGLARRRRASRAV